MRTIEIAPAEGRAISPSGALPAFNFSDYLSLHLEHHGCLLIQLTLRCPLECEHCCVDAGPDRQERLAESLVERGIRSFAELPSARLICLTGGEPFSARNLLRRSLQLCEELRLQSYVITAAHWATSLERAKATLGKLPHISLLSISADRFHEAFVPLSNIRNAVVAARELGIECNILLTVDEGGDTFESRLNQELIDLHGTFDIHRTPLGRVGRSKESAAVIEPNADDGPCRLLGSPAVTADGSVCACCQVNETNLMPDIGHALRIGTFGVDSFPAMADRLISDPLLQAIKLAGPKWIARKGVEKGILKNINFEHTSQCQTCSSLVRVPKISDALRAMLAGPSLAVQLRYLANVYNES